MQGLVCRICSTYMQKPTAVVDIFDSGNEYLLRQIQSVTGFELKNLVDHPKYMCENCLKDLGCAIKFRQRYIISQKQFAEKVNIVETEASNEETQMPTFLELDSASFGELEEDSDSQIEHFFEKIEENIEDDKCNIVEGPSVSSNLNTYEEHQAGTVKSEGVTKATPIGGKRRKRKPLGPYICDECGRVVNNFSNFREHKLRHTGIKRFQCSECMKTFMTQKELTRHIRCHTGERPYACMYCPSRFADVSSRDQHERRHTNNRCYPCSQCGKRFVSSSCLSKHKLTHIPTQRAHHCANCNQSFMRQTHLQAHMRSKTHILKVRSQLQAELHI